MATYTFRGTTFSTDLTFSDAASIIKDAYSTFTENTKSIVDNFRKYYVKNGHLSEKQMALFMKIAVDAKARKSQKSVVVTNDFESISALFKTAGTGLKSPKITFTLGDDKIRLVQAGRNSRYAGAINVTDGLPFGQNKWFGRINTDGSFVPNHRLGDVQDVVDFLKEFASDPVQTVRDNGLTSGNCCFCCKTLTDERSVKVGFGPVCASKWGMKKDWEDACK